MKRLALSILALSVSSALFAAAATNAPSIDPHRLSDDVKTLSSDAFEGRGPATAGETKTVELSFPKSALGYWDPNTKAWTVSSGSYTLYAASSSVDLGASTTLTLP